MNIKEELLKEHSKPQALRIADYIGANQERFDDLLLLFLNDTHRVTQRAAWVLSFCTDQYPFLITPHLKAFIENLQNPINDAVKRNTLRVLQEVEIPEDLMGIAAESCFQFLLEHTSPVAIKVFSMTVLFNITKKEPDLQNELKLIIEDQLPYGSAGFKSRGKKILKKLKTH